MDSPPPETQVAIELSDEEVATIIEELLNPTINSAQEPLDLESRIQAIEEGCKQCGSDTIHLKSVIDARHNAYTAMARASEQMDSTELAITTMRSAIFELSLRHDQNQQKPSETEFQQSLNMILTYEGDFEALRTISSVFADIFQHEEYENLKEKLQSVQIQSTSHQTELSNLRLELRDMSQLLENEKATTARLSGEAAMKLELVRAETRLENQASCEELRAKEKVNLRLVNIPSIPPQLAVGFSDDILSENSNVKNSVVRD
jgi:hypothetical protein